MIRERMSNIVSLSLEFIFGVFLSCFIAEQNQNQSKIIPKSGTLLWTPDSSKLKINVKSMQPGTKLHIAKINDQTQGCVYIQVKMVLIAIKPLPTIAIQDVALKYLLPIFMQMRLKNQRHAFQVIRTSDAKSFTRCLSQDHT